MIDVDRYGRKRVKEDRGTAIDRTGLACACGVLTLLPKCTGVNDVDAD